MAIIVRIGSLVGVASLMMAGTIPAAHGADSEIVENITHVKVHFQLSQPPNLVVKATGEVPTAGYTGTHLLRVVYVQPPPDGIQDYFLMSRPPEDPAAQVVSTVTASNVYPQVTVAAPWLKGVRVHGVGDGVKTHYLEEPLRVRKNILELTETELDALRAGVAAMKSRPASDPTSWTFQANMHWTPAGTPPNPLFNQCEHGTIQFLTWHRGYIYHFERILRKASGNNALTLPYWDWSTAPALPLAFRDPASPLFDGTRSINNGALLPSSVVVGDMQDALNRIPFRPGFSSEFEASPHGAVHVLIGGNMSGVPTAARDPIFWLHHGNIDRNWDAWLNLNAGRVNPSNAAFLNQSYTFVDEDGGTVSVTVADILSSQTLGYRYDDVPSPSAIPVQPDGLAALANFMEGAPAHHTNGSHNGRRKLAATSAVARDAVPPTAPPKQSLGLEPKRVELRFAEDGRELIQNAVAGVRKDDQAIFVEIHGLTLKEAPRFTYGVYLNLPEGDLPDEARRLHRVGTLDLFKLTVDHDADDTDDEHDDEHTVERLDATGTVARLKAAGRWDGDKVSITLLPVTPIAPLGEETAARTMLQQSAETAAVSYERIELRVASEAADDQEDRDAENHEDHEAVGDEDES